MVNSTAIALVLAVVIATVVVVAVTQSGSDGGNNAGGLRALVAPTDEYALFESDTTGGGRVLRSELRNTPRGQRNHPKFSFQIGNKKVDFDIEYKPDSVTYSVNGYGSVFDAEDVRAFKENSASLMGEALRHGQVRDDNNKKQWNARVLNKLSEYLQEWPAGLAFPTKNETVFPTFDASGPPDDPLNKDFKPEWHSSWPCSPALRYMNTGTGGDWVCPWGASWTDYNTAYGYYTVKHPGCGGTGTTNCLERNDGTTCMSGGSTGRTYSGNSKYGAVYDTQGNGAVAYTEWWPRYHGGYTNQCSGRCGAGCNSLDQEAMWDCFDHDACVDSQYSDGSATGTNTYYCGDELNEALGDYTVTMGTYC